VDETVVEFDSFWDAVFWLRFGKNSGARSARFRAPGDLRSTGRTVHLDIIKLPISHTLGDQPDALTTHKFYGW